MALNLIITADDIERSKKLQNQERIDTSTSDNMFLGLVYVMLSAKEKYTRQMIMYERLIKGGMTTPESIIANRNNLSTIVKGLDKDKYLHRLAEWWPESDLFEVITNDLNNGRTEEFNIRNYIATHANGLSYKCASLFMNMCGYKNVVALDSWALKALVAEDYEIKSYCYKPENKPDNQEEDSDEKNNFNKKNKPTEKHAHNHLGKDIYMDRGITNKKEYLLYEKFFSDMVSKYNILYNLNFTPFDFKQILWTKRSTWGEKFGNDPNQLTLNFDYS